MSAGETVVLIVSDQYPKVPYVIGAMISAARKRVRKAGFEVRLREDDGPYLYTKVGQVSDQRPDASPRKPGTTVTLTVVPRCTPGYSPCLAPAWDYDCAGGTGGGPRYTGTVRVTSWRDIYDLDREGDGVGCE